jgi:hypothetical protein
MKDKALVVTVPMLTRRMQLLLCCVQPCGNSTSGASAATGDCTCPLTASGFPAVLLEHDAGGAQLPAKSCSQCAAGEYVFATAAATAGGVSYSADAYTCVSCPGDHMSFDATGACVCDAGYSQVGVAAVGPLSCVEAALVNDVSAWTVAAAAVVNYWDVAAVSSGTGRKRRGGSGTVAPSSTQVSS